MERRAPDCRQDRLGAACRDIGRLKSEKHEALVASSSAITHL